MQLNHLNLTVPDVTLSREFLETYFGLECVADKGNNSIAILTDESGFILTLNNFEKVSEVTYPGAFHIGFMQESRERVDEIYRHLKSDGFEVDPPKSFMGPGPFTSSLQAASWSKSCINIGNECDDNFMKKVLHRAYIVSYTDHQYG